MPCVPRHSVADEVPPNPPTSARSSIPSAFLHSSPAAVRKIMVHDRFLFDISQPHAKLGRCPLPSRHKTHPSSPRGSSPATPSPKSPAIVASRSCRSHLGPRVPTSPRSSRPSKPSTKREPGSKPPSAPQMRSSPSWPSPPRTIQRSQTRSHAAPPRESSVAARSSYPNHPRQEAAQQAPLSQPPLIPTSLHQPPRQPRPPPHLQRHRRMR